MSRVLAALDADPAAAPVLATATALAALLGAEAHAIHVGAAQRELSGLSQAAGVPLECVPGEAAERLARAAAETDVRALVIGAGEQSEHGRPVGSTALALLTLQQRPVVVVPPGAPAPTGIASILVPLNGARSSAAALQEIVALAHDSDVRIVVAHVHERHQLPAFSDHLAPEVRAWSEEFIARHFPTATDAVLEQRVGEPHERLLDVVRDSGCDLVALGWRQRLDPGRAAVVRRMLAESPVPILIAPVQDAEVRAQGEGDAP
jgi:nucleotide-binding universal stress UspA family protein